MISVSKVIKAAGGTTKLVRLLGYPVNLYTVQVWRRSGCIPEEYRDQIAGHLGIDRSKLDPDKEGDAPRLEYRKLARAYSAVAEVTGLKVAGLAKLHNVSPTKIEEWRNGYAEPPLSAFEDLYRLLSNTGRKAESMTLERALISSGLTQSEMCRRLGVTAAMGTYWRKQGRVPLRYAEKMIEIIQSERAAAKAVKEEFESCVSGE